MVCGGETVKLAESPVPVGRRFEYRPDRPGACRVEILLGPNAEDAVPWIVSNPIYVR
jgi:hypothetical protein